VLRKKCFGSDLFALNAFLTLMPSSLCTSTLNFPYVPMFNKKKTFLLHP